MRPTKLPAFKDQFGKDGNFYAVSAARADWASLVTFPLSLGELKTIFEFELFGTGVDTGQTTFRAAARVGRTGEIRRRSILVHIRGHRRVFRIRLEYWGPNGIIWYRNVQFRFTVWSKGDSNLMIAAERPGGDCRWRCLCGPHRASSCKAAQPHAGYHWPLPACPGKAVHVSVRGTLSQDSSGTI